MERSSQQEDWEDCQYRMKDLIIVLMDIRIGPKLKMRNFTSCENDILKLKNF